MFKEYPDFDDPEKKLKNYFKSSKALKNAPLDSAIEGLYDEWKFFMFFCTYTGKELEEYKWDELPFGSQYARGRSNEHDVNRHEN